MTQAPARRLTDVYVRPCLDALGLAAQGANTFRLVSETGDAVVVEVQLASASTRTESRFYINLALVPLPWLEYMRETRSREGLSNPRPEEGLVSGRLEPPNRLQWIVTAEEVDAVGNAVVSGLRETVPSYLELFDREAFLAILRQGGPLPGRCPRRAALALLLLVTGRTAEARAALAELAAEDPDSPFVAWFT